MPIYTFQNTKTNEVFDKLLKLSERETFLKENQDLIQVHLSAPKINADLIGMQNRQKGFKEVLKNIHSRTPGSDLNRTTDLS